MKMEIQYQIREIKTNEYPLLEQFLFEAIFIPEDEIKPDFRIIKIPELAVYLNDFGRSSDLCLVAEYQGCIIGAVWTRVLKEYEKGFGFVDDETPEICMSVLPEFRNKSIGTALLKSILEQLSESGFRQVSLSVDLANYAYKMYQQFGFSILKTVEQSATMIKYF